MQFLENSIKIVDCTITKENRKENLKSKNLTFIDLLAKYEIIIQNKNRKITKDSENGISLSERKSYLKTRTTSLLRLKKLSLKKNRKNSLQLFSKKCKYKIFLKNKQKYLSGKKEKKKNRKTKI